MTLRPMVEFAASMAKRSLCPSETQAYRSTSRSGRPVVSMHSPVDVLRIETKPPPPAAVAAEVVAATEAVASSSCSSATIVQASP